MTDREFSGVWLSADWPLDVGEGAHGDTVLEVDLPVEDAKIKHFEWVEDDKPYREFMIPAALLNEQAKLRVLTDAEVDAIVDLRFPDRSYSDGTEDDVRQVLPDGQEVRAPSRLITDPEPEDLLR